MKITNLPPRNQPKAPSIFEHEAFVRLLIKQQAGITTRKEKAFIKNLLQESNEARELFSEVNETSRNENWAKPPKNYVSLYMAAGIALFLIASASYYLYPRTAGSAPLRTLKVQRGATRSIKLADGTAVELNSATTLRYPASFEGNKREVFLDGEALFSVTSDPQHPFIVHTNLADVEVLGTSFNVHTYDHSFHAALVSGSISITTRNGEKVNLRPGYMAFMESHNPQLLVTPYKPDTVLAWVNATYRFENISLKDLFHLTERIYNITIQITDKSLGNKRYSGIIDRKQPIQYLMENLGYTVGIDYYFDKTGNLILTASPNDDKKLK